MASKRKRARVKNQAYRSNSDNQQRIANGSGGVGDRGRTGSKFLRSDRYYSQMYRDHWEARKGIDIPVEDMLRHGICFSGFSDQQDKIMQNELIKHQVIEKFSQAMKLERLHGGSVIFIGTKMGEQENVSEPLNVDSLTIGDLAFLHVLPKHKASVAEWDENLLSSNYGEPLKYHVGGQLVHESRLIVFDGSPLIKRPDGFTGGVGSSSTYGFGDSVLQNIADDITRAVGTREAAYHLVNMASVIWTTADIAQIQSERNGDSKLNHLDEVMNQISIYRAAVLDQIPGMQGSAIEHHSASFGSVPELMSSKLDILCAAFDIPVVRYLGTPPSGLSTDGKSSLENYYGRLETDRQLKLMPKINKLMKIMIPCTFGNASNFDNVFPEFKPLWVESEQDRFTTNKVKVDSFKVLSDSMTLTEEELFQVAKQMDVIGFKDIEESRPDADNAAEDIPV